MLPFSVHNSALRLVQHEKKLVRIHVEVASVDDYVDAFFPSGLFPETPTSRTCMYRRHNRTTLEQTHVLSSYKNMQGLSYLFSFFFLFHSHIIHKVV